jgi:hypothetical protein
MRVLVSLVAAFDDHRHPGTRTKSDERPGVDVVTLCEV